MLLSLTSLILVSALRSVYASIAKRPAEVHGWERRWLAPRDGSIKLHIALRQADDGRAIEGKLQDISTPTSAAYRDYLRADEVAYMAVPAHGSVHAVESWLWRYGLLKDASLFGGIFEIDTTMRDAERLLNTTYFTYSDGRDNLVRTELFHLPDDVAGHVDFVSPTTHFPKPGLSEATAPVNQDHSAQDTFSERSGCGANDYVTPTCVRRAYDIDYQAQSSQTRFAVYGTEAASFSSRDLQTYLKRYNRPAAKAHAQYSIDSRPDPAEKPGIAAKLETALDTQTLLGLAWPAQGTLYMRGGAFGPKAGQTYDPFVQFLQELISNETVPSVVSFSESMPENMVDPAYAKRLCNMMAQVGTRGVTLLFSSGDNGPNGDQPTGTHNAIFEPEFPASCPWVTSVGGTTNLQHETAATKSTISIIGRLGYTASGGGFSNLFGIPDYQASTVDNYTSKHIPESYHSVPGFNSQGRGIPDISAFSTNFPVVVDGITVPVGGTSASTPLWAAIVTLLNDYQASKGRPPLGFLNPLLYSLKTGLKDITTGGNNSGSCAWLAGCRLPKTLGYNVTVGWDPVTGLGSPIFSELRKVLDEIG